ncbi:MAG: DUF3467 domain-containing protein [Bacteroides sp.]|nr:DUF3467 domain-containing protein [Bacteroides sp.]MDE6039391.1 DUF3467 domain-containing protein [Paramuribaculum sp.]MBD5297139.1 DUF3467 domain-containing protein [Bacteroides sp.]MBD5320563.1 DUF3467 domain-containing protein [Bacteroides sp.]MBD5351073.1 DUF3467 domain-containing protein [Bacteroides sp.]
MEKKQQQELKIEVTPEVAGGTYSNFTVISHSGNEFFLDFIAMAPNMPQAKVQSRIIMTPENAKNLLFALSDNIKRYEATFGEIQRILPKAQPGGDVPNPFAGGQLN